jgi:low temperature requirement protein LtrA
VTPTAVSGHHHSTQMRGRDPGETERAASPLELLFDLTFASSFGLAATQFANALVKGNYAAGMLGFGFASFAICWAWSNFSWFSSAYDTDDWIFRVATMVQMVGVLILTIGLPRMFASIERREHLDNSVMVLGYVVMRVALVSQWLRAAKEDPPHRRSCLTYAGAISIAQVGWVALIVVRLSVAWTIILGSALALIELTGPLLAERKDGGTPWHAHHIAERHSLFAIIAMGEAIVGTVGVLSAVVDRQGWTLEAGLVGVAGTGLTFGMWWIYFLVPSAQALHRYRDRAFVWGFVELMVITSIVAMGAGLHVAAHSIERTTEIGSLATMLTVASPVGASIVLLYALYYYLVRRFEVFQVWMLIATVAGVALAVIAAAFGINLPTCLLVLAIAPAISVTGYEMRGYREEAKALTD